MFLRSTVINLSLRIRNSEFYIKTMLFFLHLAFGLPFTVTVWHENFADWRFFEVCGSKFLRREFGPKLPLGTSFCGFLFKQKDYFQILLLFGKKPSQSSRTWKKRGIMEALVNG